MRALVLASVLVLAGCEAPPVEEREPRVYMILQGEDVSVAAAEIARVSGRSIEVKPGVELPLFLAFHGVPWREALDEVVKASECASSYPYEQKIVLVRPETRHWACDNVPLGEMILVAGRHLSQEVVIACDVSERVSFETDVLSTKRGWRRFFQSLVDRNRLRTLKVGDVLLVSHAPLVLDMAPVEGSPVATFSADRAPADGWFALLERVTGRHVAHGAAPISIRADGARADDILRATALASRVPVPKKPLEDLAPMVTLRSGKRFPLRHQASVCVDGRYFALVNGRVLEQGDELVPGVKVFGIYHGRIMVLEGIEPEVPQSE